MPAYVIHEIPKGAEESVEQLGTKTKFWFQQEPFGRCLCKLNRPQTGEDWSEKVAAELAELIDLPHAQYELGRFDGQHGVVTPSFVPPGCTLVHGNELLGERNRSYGSANVSRFKQAAHTLEAIDDALFQAACELPLKWNSSGKFAGPLDVFVGYVMLDAFVGNTDRHHENWGILEVTEAAARRHLAPSFDHASCLGCHLRDEDKWQRLRTKDSGFSVEVYGEKARSALYRNDASPRPMKTAEAFQHAANLRPKAARVWLDRLALVRDAQVEHILQRVPAERMSPESSEFARRLLVHNRNRLLFQTSFQ